jgi:hypothetical protein
MKEYDVPFSLMGKISVKAHDPIEAREKVYDMKKEVLLTHLYGTEFPEVDEIGIDLIEETESNEIERKKS